MQRTRRRHTPVANRLCRRPGPALSGIALLVLTLAVPGLAGGPLPARAAAPAPAAKPVVKVLSLDADLQRCVSGELQGKLPSARIVQDPLTVSNSAELVLVMYCEPQTVELRDRRGQLHTVPIQSCASVLTEHPGEAYWRGAFPKSAQQRKEAQKLGRRMMVLSSAGPMSQIYRHVINQMAPPVYRWLFDRQAGG